jgi:translation initiation factor 2B subunit (eIF-2B alpha/beta/delta family)
MANLSELILEEILSDRSDGAAVLAMRGLDALAQCARENHALEPAAFFVAILRLARRIDALRPAMGAIGTQALLAIDHARQAVENGMAWSEAIPASVAFLKEAAQNANDDIAGYAASVCGTGRRILTCSHSSTLMAAFDRLHPSRVYIGAGEPLGDGVDMAEGL